MYIRIYVYIYIYTTTIVGGGGGESPKRFPLQIIKMNREIGNQREPQNQDMTCILQRIVTILRKSESAPMVDTHILV